MSTEAAQQAGSGEVVAFGRGRQSLERSVWYSGWLLTFLATGEDTRGQFAMMEQVARRDNVPPRHIHHHEDETFYVVEGEMTFFIGDETIKATPGIMVFAHGISRTRLRSTRIRCGSSSWWRRQGRKASSENAVCPRRP